MGHIKESKLDNGMVSLEITYGGKDAPFGGVDTSAPPMYIDRNCFVDAGGFLVLHEQLVACGWFNTGVQLQGYGAQDVYLGSGSWYVGSKYRNFVLACSNNLLVNPAEEVLRYKIWTWDSGTTGAVPISANLSVIQGPEFSDATQAVAQISISNSYKVTVPTTVTVTTNAASVNITYNPPGGGGADTPQLLASGIVTLINAALGYPCTALLNSDGLTITLTTVLTGAAANATTLAVTYLPTTQPQNGVNVVSAFSGGVDSFSLPSGQFGYPLSWTAVGETLYFSGFGATLMLSYTETNGTPVFLILTQYLGASTLAKYNGQLIAAGITLGPGLRLTAPEMIIAWSAPNALGVWNPVNADGTVTGAGFNQETDISDYLTGIIISKGIAAILKTQGVDYVTPLSNGTIPFDFAHISNALLGEGAQDARLVTQYDQLGAFVGNSDIYEFAGGLNPIGSKIKGVLLSTMQAQVFNRGSASGTFGNHIGDQHGNIDVLIFFLIDARIFVYCGASKTWMILPMEFLGGGTLNKFDITMWRAFASAAGQTQFNTYTVPVLMSQDVSANPPTFFFLSQDVQNVDFTHALASYVIFPQEEVMFGRDITIDGLLVSVAGMPGQVLTFTVNGQNPQSAGGAASPSLVGTLVLPSYASPSVFQNYQVYFNTSTTDKGTMQNPQLRLDVPLASIGVGVQLAIAKIALFTSFDSNQRPV